MKTKTVIIYLLALISLGSCNTYKTFYKEVGTISETSNKKQQRLNLNNISNDSIYKLLPQFSNVYSLNLSNNLDLDLEKTLSLIASPLKLRVLILDNNELREVPKNIDRFSNLKHLSLNGNPKLNLENVFENLKRLPLEFIDLQQNELTDLPLNITNLKSLKGLNLSKNHIIDNKVFEKIKGLPKLQSLWLTDNKLKILPEALFNLSKLRNLYIEHNELKHIPDGISKMKNVWVIHAGHNLFYELPIAFAKMSKLLLLHINNCKIESIPIIYTTKRSGVKGLILDNNKLSKKTKEALKKKQHQFFLLSMQ